MSDDLDAAMTVIGAELAEFKAALLDALGMNRLRDWDDIVNAARCFRQRAEKDEREVERLQRQVQGFRGMADVYLRERNAAHAELIKAEEIIERLCDDREAGQRMVKAALTEQRERAGQAEDRLRQVAGEVDRSRARADDAESSRDRWQRRGEQSEATVERVRKAVAHKTLLAGPQAEKVVRVADLEAALDELEDTP